MWNGKRIIAIITKSKTQGRSIWKTKAPNRIIRGRLKTHSYWSRMTNHAYFESPWSRWQKSRRNFQLLCYSFLASNSELQKAKPGNSHENLSHCFSSFEKQIKRMTSNHCFEVRRDCGLWSCECLPHLFIEIKHLQRASGTFKFLHALNLHKNAKVCFISKVTTRNRRGIHWKTSNRHGATLSL